MASVSIWGGRRDRYPGRLTARREMLTHPPQKKTNEVRLLYSCALRGLAFGAFSLLLLSAGCSSHNTPQPIPFPAPRPQAPATGGGAVGGGASAVVLAVQRDDGQIERLP